MRVTAATGKSIEIRLANEATVQDIMDAVSQEWNVPAGRHQLLFRGKRLNATQTIKEVGISDSDELVLRGTIKGGCVGCDLCGCGVDCCCEIM